MPEFAQAPGDLHPAEGFLDDLAPALTSGKTPYETLRKKMAS